MTKRRTRSRAEIVTPENRRRARDLGGRAASSGSMTSRLLVAALAVSTAAAACATMPATGIPATGEPLGYRAETQHYAYTTQEKVAEVQYQDAAGRSTGSAAVYQPRTVTGSFTEWRPMQGSAFIDDEDFFRISGDVEAARAIRDYHEKGVFVNRLGLSLVVVSAAGLAAIRATHLDPSATSTRVLGGASVLGLIFGGSWAWAGYLRMKPESHLFDLDRARADAARYNAARKAVSGQPALVPAPAAAR
jgi:hypothetical protein